MFFDPQAIGLTSLWGASDQVDLDPHPRFAPARSSLPTFVPYRFGVSNPRLRPVIIGEDV